MGDPNYEAFTSKGLRPPPELRGLPRTIFDRPQAEHFYDQIAWFHEAGVAQLSLAYGDRAGIFDFRDVGQRDLDRNGLSWRISDDFPLWAEFVNPRSEVG